MSWQEYIDNQLLASNCVSKACIAGHDGGVWAKSDGFEVSPDFSQSNLAFPIHNYQTHKIQSINDGNVA